MKIIHHCLSGCAGLPSLLFFSARAEAATSGLGADVGAYMRMLWGLVAVLGVILVLYALFRKRFSLLTPKSSQTIQVREIRPLMPRKSLCLVEVRGKEYLLGIGNDSISLIAALDGSADTNFSDVLDSAKSQPRT